MTLTRRRFLEGLGWLAIAPASCVPGPRTGGRADSSRLASPPEPPAGVVLNDIHSALNETRVASVLSVRTLEDLHRAILRAREDGMAISVAGGRHSMGGQQFGKDTVHLDTRAMNRILGFDRRDGLVKVEAGIGWPELTGWLLQEQEKEGAAVWGIAQKQSGGDHFTLGGTLSANAHGHGLAMKPIIGDVESFTLIDGNGGFRTCSRSENRELFELVIGGYGLFGILYSVKLRLSARRKIRRLVEVRSAERLIEEFDRRIGEGDLFGDFELETDERSPTFLRRGIFTSWRPVAEETPIAPRAPLTDEEWARLAHLAHADKAQAFETYARYARGTNGAVEWSDTSQLSPYPAGYHLEVDRRLGSAAPGSEMLTELYVPRGKLEEFLAEAASRLRNSGAVVVYATVRLIERDRESFLAWASESFACVAINLHVDHSASGIERAKDDFRMLIDLARERGGTYYLTYHRWATRQQLLDCYPQLPDFLRLKRRHDPGERFQSDWYRHHRALSA